MPPATGWLRQGGGRIAVNTWSPRGHARGDTTKPRRSPTGRAHLSLQIVITDDESRVIARDDEQQLGSVSGGTWMQNDTNPDSCDLREFDEYSARLV